MSPGPDCWVLDDVAKTWDDQQYQDVHQQCLQYLMFDNSGLITALKGRPQCTMGIQPQSSRWARSNLNCREEKS